MTSLGGDGGTGGLDTWLQMLRDLLCELYEQWGGDCVDLGEGATAWIDKVCGTYAAQDAPSFGSPEEQTAFLGTLTSLETHLSSPRNTLSAPDTAKLTDLIADLRNDIGV